MPVRTLFRTRTAPGLFELRFCYLGYTKISQAVRQAEDQNLPLKISIRFAPFQVPVCIFRLPTRAQPAESTTQLDPTLTDEPVTKLERMAQKFGPDRFKQIEVMMKQRFVDTGLPEPTSDVMIRQTTGSHRLIWKAGEVGGPELQNNVVGALYKKHFIDGKDVGDIEGYLSDVAVETGLFMTKAEAVEWLNGEEGLPEYQEAIKKAQRMRISGVPFWT